MQTDNANVQSASAEQRATEALEAVEITLPEGLEIVAVEELKDFYEPGTGSWARTLELKGDEDAVMSLYDDVVPFERSLLDARRKAEVDQLDKFEFAGEMPKNAALFILPEPSQRRGQATLLFERPVGTVWLLVEGGMS